jgi:hypothetical protein
MAGLPVPLSPMFSAASGASRQTQCTLMPRGGLLLRDRARAVLQDVDQQDGKQDG